MRERDNILKDRARYVQRTQKALTKMNLLLHNVLSVITGKSGMDIIQAILSGERNPEVLSSFRSLKVRKPEEEIIASLTGYYKQEPKRKGKNGVHIKEGNLNDILYRILGSDTTTLSHTIK